MIDVVFKILVALVAIYIFMMLILYLLQGRMLYLPQQAINRMPASVGLQAEDLWVKTEDGIKIHGWYFHHPKADYVVVLSHGNAGNISGRLDIASMLHTLGVSVVMYDYRGYGDSEGDPSEKGLYMDLEAVVNFLKKEKGFHEKQMILYGRSIGGAVSAKIAAQFNFGGLVLDSSFTDLQSLVGELYPFVPSFLVRNKFSTIDQLQLLQQTPVLIFHSREDEIVNFRHGEKLYEAAAEPKKLVPLRGGHNDLFITSREKIEQAWAEYIDALKN